jgi:hypothetical protein
MKEMIYARRSGKWITWRRLNGREGMQRISLTPIYLGCVPGRADIEKGVR